MDGLAKIQKSLNRIDKETRNEFRKIGKALAIISKRLDNTLAKDDAKNFLTKDDAKNFLTKDDAKNFATKDDLKNLATKDDLKKYLTREDATELLVTKLNFEEFKEYVNENMFTKKEWLENVHRFDDVLQEMRDMRGNRLIFEKQFVGLDDTVDNHEKRIVKIEEKVRAL